MSHGGDIYESQLLRACGTLVTADRIRNLGSPYLLIRFSLSDIHKFAHASKNHLWLPSRNFIKNIKRKRK